LHHSSDGDELEGHYQTSLNEERDRVAIRPAVVASI
jgi:hypothetical protein